MNTRITDGWRPNPIRLTLLGIGLGLARIGLLSPDRVHRTVDLAWPRIITGLARMSKNAVDVAMVGLAIGPAAISGVGYATPFWMLAFSSGGGLAAGTIALVSQRYGAEAFDQLAQAVRSSVFVVVVLTVPLTVIFWLVPTRLISLLTSDPEAIEYGATYLKIVGFGVPFAGLNLVGSRVLIGADDAWTPMVVRAGGAITNVVLNVIFIFGLAWGVVGAALGTVIANVVVTATFAIGLVAGGVVGIGTFPVQVPARGRYVDLGTVRDLLTIGVPVIGRNSVGTVARFPMLAIVGLFGQPTVAAYVISRRVWGLMNTPGWGFSLATSSLVGQSLGAGDEASAEAYTRELTRFSVAVYLVPAALVALFAEPIVRLFVDDPTGATIPIGVALVYAACVAVVPSGVTSTVSGALTATGDTRWPLYGQIVGTFGLAIPLTYVGATTALGLAGLFLAYLAWTVAPAVVTYYRFSTGKWRKISRGYRPDSAVAAD